MMNIAFKDEEILFHEMQKVFNRIENALYKDHYELAAETSYSALEWRTFLSDSRIADWFQQETIFIQQAKYRKLLQDLSSNTKSTGLPQLMNSLQNSINAATPKDNGPIFVYTYVPLNDEEKHAPNVKTVDKNLQPTDIFRF